MARSTVVSPVLLVATLVAALAPVAAGAMRTDAHVEDKFPGWPSTLDGKPLAALPLTAREQAFARDFPGRIGRFSDGEREIVIRWVTEASRKLHPASDCFRGLGFQVQPLPLDMTKTEKPMTCFLASHGGEAYRVCERIDALSGQSWPDVSSWYWHAAFRGGAAPWWSFVVAEVATADQYAPTTP